VKGRGHSGAIFISGITTSCWENLRLSNRYLWQFYFWKSCYMLPSSYIFNTSSSSSSWQIRPPALPLFRIDPKLWILRTVGRTPWTRDQPVARPLPAQESMNTEKKQTYIYASSEIRTHDLSVRTGKNIPYHTILSIYINVFCKKLQIRACQNIK
jgi:hypothetical protein